MMSPFCFMLLSAFRQPQRFQNAAARALANVNKADDTSPGLALCGGFPCDGDSFRCLIIVFFFSSFVFFKPLDD